MAASDGRHGQARTGGPRGLVLGTAMLGAALLPACDESRRAEDALAVGLGNTELRHPVDFSATSEVLDVEVPEGAEGLSPNQRVDVFRFLHRFKREATGRLMITVPGGQRDPASIEHSLKGIQHQVTEAGVDYRIKRGSRTPRADVPLIRLAYRRPVVLPPTCDKWGENVGRNEPRLPYPNFGCATQRNTAIMVDNARDLIAPQEEDPRSSERRSMTWSGYVGTPGKSDGDGGSGAGADASKKPPTPKK
jgi:pilus assembly protein CpaD